MKFLRSASLLVVLGAVLGGILPQSGFRQMTQIAVASCQMPCCKTTPSQAPTCPMIRPAASQDLIVPSSFTLSPKLDVVASLLFRDFVVSLKTVRVDPASLPIARVVRYHTPQNSPAPPPFLA